MAWLQRVLRLAGEVRRRRAPDVRAGVQNNGRGASCRRGAWACVEHSASNDCDGRGGRVHGCHGRLHTKAESRLVSARHRLSRVGLRACGRVRSTSERSICDPADAAGDARGSRSVRRAAAYRASVSGNARRALSAVHDRRADWVQRGRPFSSRDSSPQAGGWADDFGRAAANVPRPDGR